MKKYNIILIILVFVFLGSPLIAQPPGSDVSDEVDVLSSFNAKLQTSNKLRTTPTLMQETNSSNERLVYSLPTRLLTLQYEPPVIRPLPMPSEKEEPGYNFFGKAGYGTPSSPYIDLRYNAGKGDKMDYGVRVNHHSANNSGNVANQRFSNTGLGVNGTYYTNGMGIGGNVSYTLMDRYFYGTNVTTLDTIPTTSDTTRNRFNVIRLGVNLFNTENTANDISYKADAGLYRLSDAFNGADFGLKVKGSVTKWFNDTNPLTIGFYNDFNSYNQDTGSANNNILAVQPSFTYHGENFKVKVGANLGLDSSAFVQPNVEATYDLSEGKFSIIAGWTGEVVKNSYLSTIMYNPYVFAPLELLNTRIQHQYGGVKVLLNGVNLMATIGNKPVKNLQLYLNDTIEQRFFHTRYANGNIFNIHGEAVLNLVKDLEISGTVDFNTYNLDEVRAWHLPNFESNITARYKALDGKLGLKGEVYLANSIPYINETGSEVVLAGIIDLSVGATYDFTENFGVFLDLNNLTNSSNTRWYRYPNYGFNVLGGLRARF